MCEREIAVGLDAPAKPGHRFGIVAAPQLGSTGKHHPAVGEDIAGREAEGLLDMGLGLLGSTEKALGHTDAGMRHGQISIQRQRLLAFGNTLGRSRRIDMHIAQKKRALSGTAELSTEP